MEFYRLMVISNFHSKYFQAQTENTCTCICDESNTEVITHLKLVHIERCRHSGRCHLLTGYTSNDWTKSYWFELMQSARQLETDMIQKMFMRVSYN